MVTKHDWNSLDQFYISGPMTGLPDYNYPAFRKAKAWLLALGVDATQITNPAENHDGRTDLARHEYLATAVVQAYDATIFALLPGWQHSEGCRIEVQIGLNDHADFWLVKDGYFEKIGPDKIRAELAEAVANTPAYTPGATTAALLGPTPIEEEASRLVRNGERQKNYGHPRGDFDTIARLWSPILGTEVTAEKVALAMIALKLARLVSNPLHHDSKVDVIGYAICLDRLSEDAE